jgi:hypothetical protein
MMRIMVFIPLYLGRIHEVGFVTGNGKYHWIWERSFDVGDGKNVIMMMRVLAFIIARYVSSPGKDDDDVGPTCESREDITGPKGGDDGQKKEQT